MSVKAAEEWRKSVEQIASDPSNRMTPERNDEVIAAVRAARKIHIEEIGRDAWALELAELMEEDESEDFEKVAERAEKAAS